MEALISVIPPADPGPYTIHLERPITADELHAAIKMGSRNRAPGIDGISLEFYLAN